MFFQDHAGGFLQVADAVIIAETFPGSQQLALGGSGQGVQVGKFLKEAFKAAVLDYCTDGGLLEHDLGNKDRIRVGGLSPWMVCSVRIEPAEQGAAEGPDVAQGMAGSDWFGHRGNIGYCRSQVEPRKSAGWH